MISAEGPPLQRTGALVDVMDALPAALRALGHDVSVVLPFYREIRENRAFKKKNTGIAVDVQVGDKVYRCPVSRGAKRQWRAVVPGSL